MKNLISVLLIACFFNAHAQPVNDDCSGSINLGNAPLCQDKVYSNINATASDIGASNTPECFSEDIAGDVWFSFISDTEIVNYTITISGVDANGKSISNIQAALYRGFCPANVFSLNACARGNIGDGVLSFDASDLAPNDLYYIRIDNHLGPNFQGEFSVCIEQQDIEYTMLDEGSSECTGIIYDSGGANGNYGPNENNTFTICPGPTNRCIDLNFEYYNLENNEGGNPGDALTVYNGDNIDAPILFELSGADIDGTIYEGGTCYTVQAEKCLTIQMSTDDDLNWEGFKASWKCSSIPCEIPASIQVNDDVSEQSIINSLSSTFADLKITNIDCPEGSIATFKADANVGLGLSNGILLTNGSAELAKGPNTLDGASFAHISEGDKDLDILSELYGSNLLSNDACVIEVEVLVKSNRLNFQYSFASEEYPEYANGSFNDIFALFIEGKGIEGTEGLNGKKNLAILPNSNTPIAINSVNSVNNWEYFRNNVGGPSAEYDGFVSGYLGSSKNLTASAKVIPCETYKLKFAVADRNDFIFDSGVFISELTNGVPNLSLTSSTGLDYLLEKCTDGQEKFVIQLEQGLDDTLKFAPILLGSAIEGEDYILDLPDTIIFIPGQTEAIFPITVIADEVVEGTETIQILFRDDFGCGEIQVVSLDIEIREQVDIIAQGGLDTVYACIGTPFELFAAGGNSYMWSPAEGLDDATSSNPTLLDPKDPILFTVTGSLDPFTDPSCSGTDQILVIPIEPSIELMTSDDTAFCFGDSININVINNAGDQGISWENPESGISSPNSATTIINPVAPSIDQITYYATLDVGSCQVKDSISLTVDPYAFPEILVTDSLVCEGSEILLASPTDSDLTEYLWTPSIGLDSDTIPNASLTASEDMTYTLVATSYSGICKDSAEINITVQENMVDILGMDTMFICLSDSLELQSTSTSNGEFLTWSPENLVNFPNEEMITAYPEESEYLFLDMDYMGCQARDSVWMQVDSLPIDLSIELIQDKPEYCIGEIITIVSPGYEDAHFPNIEFLWDSSPGIVSELEILNLAIVAAEDATFRRVTTNGACIDSVEREIIVLDPAIEIMVADTSVLCPFDPVKLTLTSESEIEEIMWDPSDGLTCDDCETPTASVGTTTTFTVSAMADGCPVTASATVKVAELFLFINFADPTVCAGQPVQLNLQSNGEITDINWSPNSVLSCDDCLDPIATSDQDVLIEVSAKVDGCNISNASRFNIDESVRSVTLVPSPNDTVAAGETVTISIAPDGAIGANSTFNWEPQNGSEAQIMVVADTTLTTFNVTGTDDDGCTFTGAIGIVGLFPSFTLPNAFTPGTTRELNDVFRLVRKQDANVQLDNWEVVQFKIYDRWGEKVFDCNDKACALETGWNGKINGSGPIGPAGVYIYAIQIEIDNGAKLNFRGDVTLLR